MILALASAALTLALADRYDRVVTFADGSTIVTRIAWAEQEPGDFVVATDVAGRQAGWYVVAPPEAGCVFVSLPSVWRGGGREVLLETHTNPDGTVFGVAVRR